MYENSTLKEVAMDTLSLQGAAVDIREKCMGKCVSRDLCQVAIWNEAEHVCLISTKLHLLETSDVVQAVGTTLFLRHLGG